MEQILTTLNPWWKDGKVSNELAKPYHREIFKDILKLFKYKQILILTGLRRIGKSTLLFQFMEHLLKKVKPENVLYFSFDLKVEELMKILNTYQELTKINWKKEKIFVFFDEIQKLDDWASKLKFLYDHFPNIKFVVSGSSSVNLEKEAISTLTGRYFLTKINPLNFKEFLELKKSKVNLQKLNLWSKEIKDEFKEYLKKPFPEIIEWQSDLLIKKYLKESIIDKVTRKDLLDKFKDINEDLLTTLIEIFYSNPGTYLNYDRLASDLKVSKKTLVKHIFYLEFAYLIRKVKNYRKKPLTASKKMQRIYPYHWSLIFAVTEGNVNETFVASFLDAKYYWREKEKEVDFVVENTKILPIEVKSERVRNDDLKHLIYFCQKNQLKKAFIFSSKEEKKEKIKGITIIHLPFWKLALSGKIK